MGAPRYRAGPGRSA